LAVRLIEYRSGATGAEVNHPIEVSLEAAGDLVLDLQAYRRSTSTAALTWTIDRLVAGGTVDAVVLDSAIGTTAASFTGHEIQDNVYRPTAYGMILTPSTSPRGPSGRYSAYFYHGSYESPSDGAYFFDDVVLIAFDTAPANVTPTSSGYIFSDVRAGEVIGIRHSSPDTTITFTVTSDVDADIPNPYESGAMWSQSDGSGRIDLFTNGWIVEHETVGDMLVGTIESTDADVTLLADDALASIVDAEGDADADVIGTHLTMTANGTIGTGADHLEIRSSNAARGWVDA